MREELKAPDSPNASTVLSAGALLHSSGTGPSALPASTARQVGHFLLMEELGRGAMGIVYRGWDSKLSRVVAVKVLSGLSLLDESRAARFRREAQTAAKLRYPCIVQVHEVGEAGDLAYIVMEYIEGATLRRHLQSGRPDVRKFVRIVKQIAEALDSAHRLGVVHRDVKPENILIDANGSPYLGDFGLALEVGTQTRLTMSGVLLGTPSYMSPEQAAGDADRVSASTDLYALGAVLYEVLTGVPPHQGKTVHEVVHAVGHDEVVRPSARVPGVPRELETICLKCLERDPSHRYATAAALAADLGRYLSGEPIQAHATSVFYRWRKKLARRKARLFGAAVIAAALLVGTLLTIDSWSARTWMRTEMTLRDSMARVEDDMVSLESWGRRKAEQEAGDAGYAAKLREVEDLLRQGSESLPDHPDLLVARARYQVLMGREDDALSLLDRLDRHPGSSPRLASFVRGWALYRKYARAKEEPAARLIHWPVPNGGAVRLEDIAPDTLEEASYSSQGLEALRLYLESGPPDARAWRVRLAFAYMQNHFDEVETLYDQALQEDEGIAWDLEAHWVLAQALYFAAVVKPVEADRLATLEKALTHMVPLEPRMRRSAEYWAWRGIVEHAAPRHLDAIDSCQRALELDPGHTLAAHNRAFAFQCLEKEKAMRGDSASPGDSSKPR